MNGPQPPKLDAETRGRVLTRSFSTTAAHRAGGSDRLPAVVLCPGLIQNRAAFEAPTRSLSAHLRREGWCVYLLELPGRARPLGHRTDDFASAVDELASPAVERVLERHPAVAYVGHSLGGLIGVSLPPPVSTRLAAMVTVGSPYPSRRWLQVPSPLAAAGVSLMRQLHKRGVPFPGAWAGAAFRTLRPAMNARWSRYPLQVYAPGSLHPADLDWFLSTSWAEDSCGVVADLLELAIEDDGYAGTVPLAARLADLDCPLLVIGGNLDGLAPPAMVRAFYEAAGARERELTIFGPDDGGHFGHVDLLIGRLAPQAAWDRIVRFLRPRLRAHQPG